MKFKYHIIIPQGALPEKFELSAVHILLSYFKRDIAFLSVTSSKTPDIIVENVRWEIKSPLGKGKRNIQHQFDRALKQSGNVIFDARRSKMDIRKIRRELRKQVGLHKAIKRLILITKEEKVEVLK